MYEMPPADTIPPKVGGIPLLRGDNEQCLRSGSDFANQGRGTGRIKKAIDLLIQFAESIVKADDNGG